MQLSSTRDQGVDAACEPRNIAHMRLLTACTPPFQNDIWQPGPAQSQYFAVVLAMTAEPQVLVHTDTCAGHARPLPRSGVRLLMSTLG